MDILEALGIDELNAGAWTGPALAECTGSLLASRSPGNGALLASVQQAGATEYEAVVEAEAFRRRYPTSIRLAKVTYDLCMTYFDKGDFAKAR